MNTGETKFMPYSKHGKSKTALSLNTSDGTKLEEVEKISTIYIHVDALMSITAKKRVSNATWTQHGGHSTN